jgi:drug/metabolite transporter (DMT)-like permease
LIFFSFVSINILPLISTVNYFIDLQTSAPFPLKTFIAMVISFIGIYMLSGCAEEGYSCFDGGMTIGVWYLLAAAVGFSLDIILTGYAVATVSPISFIIFIDIVCTIISLPLSFLLDFDGWSISVIKENWLYIVGAAACNSFGMLLQSMALQSLNSTVVSFINSLDSEAGQ